MSLSVKKVKNYRQWGCDAWILKNDLVSLAIVPSLGGRIMEFALGRSSLIFSNPDISSKIVAPGKNQDWPNYGGNKIWPAPQNTWKWPPPPTLDHGKYELTKTHESNEAITILLRSPVEKWEAPGIRFERHITLKHNSTKAFLKETLINEGDTDVSWGIWNITQQIVNHPGKNDYEHFWAYFPVNSKSRYGAPGVYFTKDSEGWKGEVAPGIYGVQYTPDGQKIFADSHEGWIGFTDRQKQIVNTKTFPNYHGKTYPDNDARLAVYMNQKELPYLEIEVMGPIVELAPGEATSFSIDWGMAQAQGPILDVNDVGIVTRHLTESKGKLEGKYGVFYKGSIYMVFRDMRGVMLKKTLPQNVSPSKPAQINQAINIDPDVRLIEVQFNNEEGHTLGVLDSLEIIPEK
ncbi:DUF4380 domain-containing protein [bacterium]|nr:DUF4380 domain-containing protein [bacterium]